MFQRLVASCVLSALLAACGGSDDGSGGGGGSSVNAPPVFTSATAASVAENTAGTFYTAAATDPQGDAVTYAISGGADAARFAVTAGGALSFATAPDFDLPADADGDNVYQLTIEASDGRARTTLALAVTVTNSREGVQVRRVATGLTGAVALSVVDADRVLVADASGGVTLVDIRTGSRNRLLPGTLSGPRDGILAIAPSPDFATSGTFFVLYQANGFVALTRYLLNAGSYVPDNFGNVLATAATGYVGGGWLQTEGDAILVGIADGVPSSAQTAASTSRLGKLFRLRPNPDPYAGASPQFFLIDTVATGFRMPVGGGIVAGQLFVADRGQAVRDEIDRIDTAAGGNFGWPFKEGTQTVATGPTAGLIDPVAEYARGTAARDGQGIVGLIAYRGSIASLSNRLLAIDASGKVFTVPIARLAVGATLAASAFEVRTQDFAPDVGTIGAPLAIGGDAAGTVYVLDGDGELFRLNADGS